MELIFKKLVANDSSRGIWFKAWYEAALLTLYSSFYIASTEFNDIKQPKSKRWSLHISSLA